jgi:hypothetical protein
MKIRLSVIAALALVLAAALGAGGVAMRANAGPLSDDLARCLEASTTEQDKDDMVRWIFASTAQHPAVASLTTISPEERADMSSRVAIVFERLLTRDCRQQFHDARKSEGEETVSRSFGILVQTAMGGLIENPTVSSALASVDSYLDKQKIAAAMEDVPGDATERKSPDELRNR